MSLVTSSNSFSYKNANNANFGTFEKPLVLFFATGHKFIFVTDYNGLQLEKLKSYLVFNS